MNKFIIGMAFGVGLEVAALAVLTAPPSASAGSAQNHGQMNIAQKSRVSSKNDAIEKSRDIERDARLGFGPCGVVGEGYICSP